MPTKQPQPRERTAGPLTWVKQVAVHQTDTINNSLDQGGHILAVGVLPSGMFQFLVGYNTDPDPATD
jgi:hypothetical protein